MKTYTKFINSSLGYGVYTLIRKKEKLVKAFFTTREKAEDFILNGNK